MNTLNTLVLIAHVLIAASIIGLVMLQKGKGADAGAGFGAGASGTVFGASGSSNFLSRSTAVAATLFFVSSLSLAYLNRNAEVAPSLLDEGIAVESISVEATPGIDDLGAEFDLPPLPEPEVVSEPESIGDEVPVISE